MPRVEKCMYDTDRSVLTVTRATRPASKLVPTGQIRNSGVQHRTGPLNQAVAYRGTYEHYLT